MESDAITIKRSMIRGNGFIVPCVLLTPRDPLGSAIVVHGYGGCKEEQLGLAWRIAESGVCACVIDLRGHGEHMLAMDEHLLDDVNAAVGYCRHYGKVAVVGHSMGGRLALLSDAGYAVAISPALSPTYHPGTHEALKSSRSYRVRESSADAIFEILAKLPVWQQGEGKPASIVYGSRDVRDIMASCEEAKAKGADVVQIDQALHSDIFLLDRTFSVVSGKLREWFYKD